MLVSIEEMMDSDGAQGQEELNGFGPDVSVGPNVEGWLEHGTRANRFVSWSRGTRSGKTSIYPPKEPETNSLDCEDVTEDGDKLQDLENICLCV